MRGRATSQAQAARNDEALEQIEERLRQEGEQRGGDRPLEDELGVGETDAGCPAIGSCERTGTRWVLGGGVGLWNPMSNVSASVGINHVFLTDAKPIYGVNVVLGGR